MSSILSYLKRFNRAWFIAWIFLYVAFLALALINPDAWPVITARYGGLVLALAFVVCYYREDYLLVFAFTLTLLADAILIFDHVSIYGVIVFIFAQLAHFSRLLAGRRYLLVICLCSYVVVTLVGLLENLPPLYILCGIYLLTLLANLEFSVRWLRSSRKSLAALFALVGFSLFLACDLCVGLSYFSSIGVLSIELFFIANYLAWFFYYPSQIFLANSSKLNKTMIQ